MLAILRILRSDFVVNEIELLSPLPRDECMRRIREEIDMGPFGARPMVGRVGKNEIQVRKRIGYSNGFRTQLTATFVADDQVTRIYCQFGMQPVAIVLMLFWFGMVAFIGAVGIFSFVTSEHGIDFGASLLLGLMTLIMLGFGVTFVHFGRYMAREEQPFLTDLLQTKLDARPI